MDVIYTGDAFRSQTRGGVSRYFCEIASKLDESHGVNVFINAPIHYNQHLKETKFRDGNWYLPISTQKFGFNKGITRLAKSLEAKRIGRHSANLIHLTSTKSQQISLLKPSVITIFDLIREKEDKSGERLRHLGKILSKQQTIITISETTKKDILENFNVKDSFVKVTYLGVSPNLSQYGKTMMNPVREPFILYVGQRGGYKNFEMFLKAFAIGPELKTNFKVIAAGGGKFSKEENLLLDKLDLAKHVKQVNVTDSQLGELYSSTSLFVFPSRSEGFGLPIIEAIQSGAPIACSDIPVFREIGFDIPIFFDPSSLESINFAIMNAINGKSKGLSFSPDKIDPSRFSWATCARNTFEIYGECLSN